MRGDFIGNRLALVADAASAVFLGIAVDAFDVGTAQWDADAIVVTDHGGEVAHHHHDTLTVAAPADVGDDALVGVVAIDPLETTRFVVESVDIGIVFVELSQIPNQAPDTAMERHIVEQVPIEAGVVIPFQSLREFHTHEQQFFPGVGEHEGEIGAQVGEALPGIARHFIQQRPFAVDDFVMGEGEDEVFAVAVQHAEGQIVLVVPAMYGILGHVEQGIVHPPHVPLEAEAQTAHAGGTGDHGPGCGFLGDGDGTASLGVDLFVEGAQEGDGPQVFVATVIIGDPLPGLAAVIVVEHGGDGIDAQAVQVVFLDPEQGIGHQEIGDFGATEVVDQGIPILVIALPGIVVFKEGGAVEASQTVTVGGEVPGNPVHENTDIGLVQTIDEIFEIFWGAEPMGWGVHACGLVSPGAVKREFADGEEFHMGEPHLGQVFRQVVGQLPVGQVTIVFIGVALPGTQMDFIDGHGLMQGIPGFAFGHPGLVPPHMFAFTHDDGGVARRGFACPTVGVCLEGEEIAVGPFDFIFVQVARHDFGNEQFPDAAFHAQTHGVTAAIPIVEGTDDADAPGIGCPYGEQHALHAVEGLVVGTQALVNFPVPPFREQVGVHFPEDGPEAVGIFHILEAAAEIDPEAVCEHFFDATGYGDEQSFVANPGHVAYFFPGITIDDLDFTGSRQEGAHAHAAGGDLMHTQCCERVAAVAVNDLIDLMGCE